MAVIDDAIALEQRAERSYREAGEATSDPGAQRVLTLLADQEAHHAEILREMGTPEQLSGPNLIEEARGWVQGRVEGGSMSISSDPTLLDLLRRAMDIERTTESFYREHADSSDDDRLEALFHRLAEIEHEHFQFVSSLVEYYNRPNEWVEDAEFGTRPEY